MTAPKAAAREFLLSFWKIHILHHAAEHPLHGQWMIAELRRHGYEISPGTLYPILNRMESHGWIRRVDSLQRGNPKAKKSYRISAAGKEILALLREEVEELHEEIHGSGHSG